MPISESSADDGQLFTRVDDEQYDELTELTGQSVVHISVWEEDLVEAMRAPAGESSSPDDTAADIDLYLGDGVYFELYGTLCYTDLDAPPMNNLSEIEQRIQQFVKEEDGLQLEEIAVDEDDGLVLVLAQNHQPKIYLQVGAWLLDEWEELPDILAP
jgi:hypothetical protein